MIKSLTGKVVSVCYLFGKVNIMVECERQKGTYFIRGDKVKVTEDKNG